MTAVSSDLSCSYASVAQNVGMSQLLRLTPEGGGGGGVRGRKGRMIGGRAECFNATILVQDFARGSRRRYFYANWCINFIVQSLHIFRETIHFPPVPSLLFFSFADQYFPQVIFIE